MAETLRELVVSLSLNGENFNQNIKSINQRVREAESNFKLLGAGVNGFESTMRGATSRVASLRQALDLQNKSVNQFEQRLKKANAALTDSRSRAEKQAAALEALKRAQAALPAEIARTEAAFKASAKATGDNTEEAIGLSVKLDELKKREKELAVEIKDGEAKLEAATKSVQRNEDAVSKAQVGLNEAKAAVKETKAELDKLSAGLGKVGAALGVMASKAVAAGDALQGAGRKLSTRVTAPIAALGAFAFKAAVEFEDAFAGVRKTVDATEEELAEFERDIKGMSLEVPSTTTVISQVMGIAGQLGIVNDMLTSFTRTMIDLSNTTDLSAEKAATEIAQFANITGMQQSQVRNFGSALVDLGNSFATSESRIMSMASRLAAAGSQVGMSESQILGFATALASVGLEAEAGGTAFSKAIKKMEVAVATGKNGLSDFAKVAGMSQKKFIEAWKEEPATAIEAFIVGLAKMDEAGISAIATLEDMGLKEARLSDTLLRAKNANELFAKAQIMASRAWEENTALATEAEMRYGTVASQLAIIKNRVSLAVESLGSEMMPMARRAIEAVSGLIDRFMALDTGQKEQIIRWAAIAAAAGPTLIVLGKITGGAGKTVQALLQITRALKGLGAVNLGWIGLAVAGVAGLAVAIEALNEQFPSMERSLGKIFDNTDKEIYERGKVAFDVQVETTVTADDYRAKINGAINEIKEALKGVKGLDKTEQAEVLQAISEGSGIDVLEQALEEMKVPPGRAAEITATYTTAMEEISTALTGLNLNEDAIKHIEEVAAAGGDVEAALKEYGIDDTTAKDVAGQITGSMDKVDAAIKELRLSPEDAEALKAGALSDRRLIGIALKLMGAPQDVVDGVLAGYDAVAGSMAGKITGLLDEVAAALTDGKPDDPKTMAALEKKFRDYFSNTVGQVNQWAEDEIAKLDVASATYDADVANIQAKAGEMRTALEGQQKAALSFLSAMAGKSAEEVRARLGELAEVEEAVQRVLAEIEAAKVAANEQGAQASKITKAGSARDVETATRAFGHEKQTRDNKMDALEAQYKADLVELESKYDTLGRDEYEKQSSALADKYAADTAAAIAAYESEVNALLLGLGKSLEALNPELAAALKEAAEAVDLGKEIDKLLALDYDMSNFKLPKMSEGVKAALKQSLKEMGRGGELEDLDFSDFMTALGNAGATIGDKADEALRGIDLDAGWIDEALKVALEGNAFAGLEGVDLSTAEGKMKALFTPLGTSATDGLVQGISGSKDKAQGGGKDLADATIKGSTSGFQVNSPSKVYEKMGGQLVDGLVLGVKNSTWKIRLAMIAMAKEAIRAAKDALGIASPSKIFRDEVGRMMVRGISVGVEAETEQQRKAIANATRYMTATAADAVRGQTSSTTYDHRNQSRVTNIREVNVYADDADDFERSLIEVPRRRARGYGKVG